MSTATMPAVNVNDLIREGEKTHPPTVRRQGFWMRLLSRIDAFLGRELF